MSTMFEHNAADVFAIPDFWKPSSWLDEPLLHGSGKTDLFSLNLNAEYEPPASAEQGELPPAKDGFFKIPMLLDHLPVEQPVLMNIDSLDTVSSPLPELGLDDDIWLPQAKRLKPTPQYRDWESFGSRYHQRSNATFLTESGPEAFDVFLSSPDNGTSDTSRTVQAGPYCASLLALALGRASVHFAWDARKKTFHSTTMATVRITGFSTQCLSGVVQTCLECGTSTRLLRLFVERTYTSNARPSTVSLANVTQHVLLTVQRELGPRGRDVRSVLQLQALVRPVQSVMKYLRSLVAKLSKTQSDELMLSCLYEEVQAAEYGEVFLRDIMREVLRHMSKPWLEFVTEWIGLEQEKGVRITKSSQGKSFVKTDTRIWVDDMGFELEEPDYFLDHANVPSFIPEEMAQSLFETGRNLRFIRANHPEHPFSGNLLTVTAQAPLDWQYDWDAIQDVEHMAQSYEASVSKALNGAIKAREGSRDRYPSIYLPSPTTDFHFFGIDESQSEQRLLASIAALDQPIPQPPTDGLTSIITTELFSSSPHDLNLSTSGDFTPHFTLLPLLSFGPPIASQARLINHESTRLLFSSHSLRAHLSLQHRFHLLGNGVFLSRLSHALFDPDLSTAERRSGVALTGGAMGLRLAGRETWPPASSELRLALMGVLSESYQHGRAGDTPSDALPGDLSFAVRDLPPEEMAACMDPHSLAALDFLRLSYKPPAALRQILTPVTLARYDRIFRLLLRVLRVQFVVTQLFNTTKYIRSHFHDRAEEVSAQANTIRARFRVEAQQFINALAAYFFDTGITLPWSRFEAWLDGVQADLEKPYEVPVEGSTTGKADHSPEKLRARQEQTLDEVMSVLLLRKKQAPVLKLLEDIFGVVLEFARVSEGGETVRLGELYAAFRKKVGVFITVCWGLSEKSGSGAGADGEGGSIAKLLLMLDMTGYYRKPS